MLDGPFNSLYLVLEGKVFFLPFFVDILPRGSAYFCGSESSKPKSCGSNGSGSYALPWSIQNNDLLFSKN